MFHVKHYSDLALPTALSGSCESSLSYILTTAFMQSARSQVWLPEGFAHVPMISSKHPDKGSIGTGCGRLTGPSQGCRECTQPLHRLLPRTRKRGWADISLAAQTVRSGPRASW